MRSRSQMSPTERRHRSKLLRLLQEGPILRGTLSILRNLCGKSNCKCAKGKKHQSLYVTQSRKGKRHSRCVPKALREKVKEWITRYHEIQDLLEKLSMECWRELDERHKKDNEK